MKALKKGFEASTVRVNINIDGQTYEVANLRKSGILHQNIILVGQEGRWLEVDCIKLAISNDLVTFKKLVDSGEITPSNIGLYKGEYEPPKQYGLQHEDFVKLESIYPNYPYFLISHLYRNITKYGRKSCYADLNLFMKRISESGKTIHEWLKDSENEEIMFVERVKKGEPLEVKITDNDMFLLYRIHNVEGVYNSEYKLIIKGQETTYLCEGFETIRSAEARLLTDALQQLKKIIVESQTPEIYYELFRKIQNKSKIINMNEKTKIRESQLAELGLMFNPAEDSFIGYGFTVSGNSLENDSDEEWQNLIDRIEGTLAENEVINKAEQNEAFPAISPEPLPETPAAPAPQQGGSEDARIAELITAGLKYDGERTFELNVGTYAYIAVDILDIKTYSDRKWTGLMIDIEKMKKGQPTEVETPPAPDAPIIPEVRTTPEALAEANANATPAKKPVSIATIGALSSDRIEELQGLKEKQLKAVADHPFIKITDDKTLKKAKTAKAALLKASTGTEKIETDATKYLNNFKKMLKDFISPLSKITRDAHDKQATEIQNWEKAEALRVAAEQKARLDKIKQRTDTLFAIPMTFNGTAYNIGTLYIMPSQIGESTDEEFNALVQQAQSIKDAIDQEALKNKAKEDELEAARRKIAELTGQPYVAPTGVNVIPVSPPAPPLSVEAAAEMIDKVIPPAPVAPPAPAQTANAVPPAPPAPATNSAVYNYQLTYKEALPGNDMLHKLDMENLQAIENPNYLKARAYFIRGTKDVAQSIQDILNAPTQEGVKKSEQIAALCQILLNQ